MKKIRVGLVGYGLSGAVFHAPLISAVDGLILTRIVSSRPAKVLGDYPAVSVDADVDALLAAPDVDLVVVSTPNPTHFAYVQKALTAGKHVIVEKPFVNTVAEADQLIDLAARQGRLLSVFQNRRWDNDFLTVKKCIDEGLLGDIYNYEAHYHLNRPEVGPKWKEHAGEGSGALYDLGPHVIDQALCLFGMPATVYADLACQRPGADVDDYFQLILGYGPLRVSLRSSSIVKKAGPRYQVHGSKGSLLKSGADPQQGDLARGLRPGHPAWGRDSEEGYAELTLGRGIIAISRVETIPGCYEAYYKGIYEAITAGGPPPVSAADGRRVIRIIEYARQSHAERRVIDVPDNGR